MSESEPKVCQSGQRWYIVKQKQTWPHHHLYLHSDNKWRNGCQKDGWYDSLEDAENILNYPEPDFVIMSNQ